MTSEAAHVEYFSLLLSTAQATKKLTGTATRKKAEKVEEKKEEKDKKDENVMTVFFDPGHYTVMENVGKFTVTVCREGDLSHPIEVDFNTEDGTANDGSDYEGYNGTLTFHAGESHKSVSTIVSLLLLEQQLFVLFPSYISTLWIRSLLTMLSLPLFYSQIQLVGQTLLVNFLTLRISVINCCV